MLHVYVLHACIVSQFLFVLPFSLFRACLHGGGGPQVGEVTRLGGVARLYIQSFILM